MLALSPFDKLALGGVAGTTVVFGAAAVVTQAALSPESQIFGYTLVAGNDPSEVALTFDDGPNDAATPELLDMLASHNARATFFVIGRWVRERPEIVRAIHAAGHLVGNHTMTHPWLTTKTGSVIREQLRGCNQTLEDLLGIRVRYFRAPHGARRPVVLRAAAELGLVPVQWNVMGDDWKPIGAEGILSRVDTGLRRAERRRRGANILLHDGFDVAMGSDRRDTLAVTEQLLDRFGREGRRLVTVDAWG